MSGPTLSIRQYKAAKKLAIGFTQQQAADAADVDVRTIRRWLDEPEFDGLVRELEAQTWDRIGDRLGALFEHCMEIHFAMLRREIEPSDPVYIEAKELIIRYGGKRAFVDPASLPAPAGATPEYPSDAGGVVDSTFA